MKLIPRAFVLWLPIVVATSGLFIFSYWAVQQNYRASLNDPQVQIAEDASLALGAGETPGMIVPTGTPVDIAHSLLPWFAIYDSSGAMLGSNGIFLNAESPQLPQGVFDPSTWKKQYAIPAGETRFSWQAAPDVRQAIVLVKASNGDFVASGRNMREGESQEATLSAGFFLAWGATELGTLIVILVLLALGWM